MKAMVVKQGKSLNRTRHPLLVAYLVNLKLSRIYFRNFIFRLLNYPVQLTITLGLWSFMLSDNRSFDNWDFRKMAIYFSIVLAVSRLLPFAQVSRMMSGSIYRGDLVVYLARPIRPWWEPIASIYAQTTVMLIVIAPVLIAYIFIMNRNTNLTSCAMFLFLLVASSFLQFWFYYIIGILAFWLDNINGILFACSLLISLFAGTLLPLTIFPEWALSVLMYTPFPYFYYLPTKVLIENEVIGVVELLTIIFWAIVFVSASFLLYQRGQLRFTGHGV